MSVDFHRMIAETPTDLETAARREALLDAIPSLPAESRAVDIHCMRRELQRAITGFPEIERGAVAYALTMLAAETAADALSRDEIEGLAALLAMAGGIIQDAGPSDRSRINAECRKLFLRFADGDTL